jgi:hypothetical protein
MAPIQIQTNLEKYNREERDYNNTSTPTTYWQEKGETKRKP